MTADVGDRVWLDENFDGTQDGPEPGVEGVTVHLFEEGGFLVDSTATDADGDFLFRPVPSRIYLAPKSADSWLSCQHRRAEEQARQAKNGIWAD